MDYFNCNFLIICLVALIGIDLLIDFYKKYIEYSKNKYTKFEYLPHITKSLGFGGYDIFLLICFIPCVLLEIKNIKLDIRIFGSSYVINLFYSYIPYMVIYLICTFIIAIILQVVSRNVILVNNEFVVFSKGRINFGQVNSVDIFPVKGVFKRRKVEIYANGKLHTRFSVRNKYISEITSMFKDKCVFI